MVDYFIFESNAELQKSGINYNNACGAFIPFEILRKNENFKLIKFSKPLSSKRIVKLPNEIKLQKINWETWF